MTLKNKGVNSWLEAIGNTSQKPRLDRIVKSIINNKKIQDFTKFGKLQKKINNASKTTN